MYWVAVEPDGSGERSLKKLRDGLFARVDSTVYDIEPNPHITIVPGFSISNAGGEVLEEFDEHTPFTVEFNEFHIWPSIDNPMVIALTPSDSSVLNDIQSDVLEVVESEGSVEYEPKPFHLTLFKGGDAGDETSFSAPESSVSAIETIVEAGDGLPVTVTFDSVELKEWVA